jgi:hypothetical protein
MECHYDSSWGMRTGTPRQCQGKGARGRYADSSGLRWSPAGDRAGCPNRCESLTGTAASDRMGADIGECLFGQRVAIGRGAL